MLMNFPIGMENNVEGRSLAWALGHPGCFAYESDSEAALAAMPNAIRDYIAWIKNHTQDCWIAAEEIQVNQAESWTVYSVNEDFEKVAQGYEVNAWFLHDWKPLTAVEVKHGLMLLSWSRSELLEVVKNLDPGALDEKFPGERWSIKGILGHIAIAEWWYLDRLGKAFPRKRLPEPPFERLEMMREYFKEVLPAMIDQRLVVGADAEFWSPRKVLRRAAWHERDHTEHIRKLIIGK